MYEQKLIPFNDLYGNEQTNRRDNRKVAILHNSSSQHITITLVDPELGTAIEVMVRKDQLPEWLTTDE